MYVGAVPTTGDFKILDSITTSSATTFNLRQGGVAVYPQSANHCLVVLNGVLQTAGSSFNIVNDTIVFASSLASSDVINQILVLGNVNDIGVPSSDSVGSSHIQDDSISDEHLDITAITGQTAITSLADTDKFLVSDASDSGNLKYVEKQYLPSGSLSLIKTESVTSSTSVVNVTNCFSTTYDTYLVLIYRLLPVTDAEDLRMRFLTSTSTEVSDSSYDFASRYFDQDGSASSNTGNNQTKFVLADSIDNTLANGGCNATLWFNLDKNTSGGNSGSYTGTAQYNDGSAINHTVHCSGVFQDATSVKSPTGLKFFGGSGNITSVKISVYGVTK